MASKPIVLEIDKLKSASGTILEVDSIMPSSVTPIGSVLTWTSSGFSNDNSFAQTTYVDGLHTAVIGGATVAADSLGKVETALSAKAAAPSADSLADEVLRFVGGTLVNDNTFATKAHVTNEVNTVKNDILGGAGPAYDTLLEIQNELQSNDTDIANLLTTMANKAPVPSVDTGATEVLAWRSGAWVNDTSFAQTAYVDAEVASLVGGATAAGDTLAKLETSISGISTAYQAADASMQTQITNNDTDISALQTSTSTNTANLATEITNRQNADTSIIGGASATHNSLGKIEAVLGGVQTDISGKAPMPPTGIQPGEFLRWDETNGVFTFATPATGSTGTTIPTPSATTDTSTAGSTEVLIWDNTSGDLKNVSSPFVEKPSVSAAGEYLSWNGTSLVNSTPTGGGSTPPTQTSTNTFLYHDGTSWQYGTPSVASGAGTTVTSGVVQAVNNTVAGGEALSASGYSSKGFATITTQLLNSMVLFMTSGVPQVNGEAHMYVHWRYRDTSSSPWSAYQDTGKILMRIAESYTLSEPREGGIAIHAPMRPAGAEIEYRVYFNVVAGTIYYPDNSVVSQLTNMTLMEVAL